MGKRGGSTGRNLRAILRTCPGDCDEGLIEQNRYLECTSLKQTGG
jgi:hypothetical protein